MVGRSSRSAPSLSVMRSPHASERAEQRAPQLDLDTLVRAQRSLLRLLNGQLRRALDASPGVKQLCRPVQWRLNGG